MAPLGLSPALLAGLVLLVFASAVLHLWAEYRGPHRLVYLFKPLTTTLVFVIAWLMMPPVMGLYRWLLLAGLLCSLAGDVFLMLPNDRFVPGLVSFLVAHFFYIGGFVTRGGWGLTPWVLLLFLLYGGVMLWQLRPHVGTLLGPVIVYMAAILVMGWQAAELWLALRDVSALLALVGALLFVVSDSTLALDRFKAHFSRAALLVLSTYYTAQLLLALSIGRW